ncbi:hypothetical protein NP233_g7401 [Leucocoprinus birnbaumii]|uniref:FAD-binding PCMH-type domain-containing protein n=1 Tax=Leucocoprinus birnbaumii TaxID=56174 RepID=A0AAD5YQ07_9AGAR|nr:hypothetical protein NP233_g7401 [Leucocoprinus birnbaumii]
MASAAGLLSHIKGDVITPDHPEYNQSIYRWARNAQKKAAFVVFVKDEADVSAAILFAKENSIPIAIRGGGHSPFGASSVEGGLVIDLSRYLNGVRVDPAKRLAFVGGGALWETVDQTTIVHGLGTVGGTVNHTGVGGLILGGGFGWLSGEHGLTIDNLLQVTIVSADGTVRKANKEENPDLYFGVRGGGSNFGVVTELVMALHPQRKTVFAGTVIFQGNQLENLVKIAQEWYPNASPKEAMFLYITCESDGTPVVMCQLFFNGSEEEGRANFKRFYDVGSTADLAKEVPYEILNGLQNPYVLPDYGTYWKGVAHKGPEVKDMLNTQQKALEVVKGGRFMVQVLYEWIPLNKINSVPMHATAYRRIPDPNCMVIIRWPGEAHSDEKVDDARTVAYQIASCVVGGESNLKDAKSQGYANYDPEGILGDKVRVKDKAQVVFGENYPALQKIKKQYDPDNIFNRCGFRFCLTESGLNQPSKAGVQTPVMGQRVQGDVVTPDHPEYPKSIRRWAINAERQAAVVIFVKDEADIATVLSYVRDHKIPFAICGGGHSASGASSVTGGLVIDLSRYIDGVRVDPEERLAYVGGGALWGTVDRTAIQYGLATVCGTVEHTGVGGFVFRPFFAHLGSEYPRLSDLLSVGGDGWLCPEYGLVIDNLVQVTVVSADGVTRKASETENPDLFFGVRGGGCNFGIVTEFVLRLHPQRRTVYAGTYRFSADKLKAVVEATQAWLPTVSTKEGIIMMPTCQPDGTPVIICYLFFNGSEDEGRARFKWLFDIGPFQDTTGEMPFEKLNAMQESVTDHGNGVYWKGLTVKCPDYEAMARAHKRIAEVCEDGRFTAVAIYEWWSLDKIMSVPPEKTVFHRHPNYLCLVLIGWRGETNSEEKVHEARKYAHEVAELVVAGLTDMSDPQNRGYNNYDNEGVKDAKEEIPDKAKINFGVHYPTLQKIKKKYDPENIFNRWLAITPAD